MPRIPIRTALLASCALAATVTLSAQQPPFHDPLLDRLAGNWVLTGTVRGTETTHDVSAGWVLEHRYLQIHEVSREKNPTGQPAYEATVFVGTDPKANQYVAVWLDVYGGISAESLGRASRDGDAIPFVFKDQGGADRFHNTFAYDRHADRWTWSLDNVKDGKPAPFARFTLTRR
jgi:hypothetical protein